MLTSALRSALRSIINLHCEWFVCVCEDCIWFIDCLTFVIDAIMRGMDLHMIGIDSCMV